MFLRRDALGFRIAEQDPEHGGVFMTLGDGFHTIDITQHPSPGDAAPPQRGQLGLVHIAFKVASYAALREAYAHLLQSGVEIQRATDHVCQRSLYFADPDGNGLPQRPRRRGRGAAALRPRRPATAMARREVARRRGDGQGRSAARPDESERGRLTAASGDERVGRVSEA